MKNTISVINGSIFCTKHVMKILKWKSAQLFTDN